MKVGYVAIVGLPNVGKSTLMNSLLHQKLTIVSPKPQTTRHRILGILNGEGHQVIFLDTPGLIEPRYHLQDAMMKAAQRTMQESDLILVMVDASNAKTHELEGVKQLEVLTAPKLLLINKIDKVPRSSILPIIDRFDKMHVFHDILPVSALKAEGLDTLISIILDVLPEGDPFYSPDAVSDEPERFFVSELIREKIYFNFQHGDMKSNYDLEGYR